jgi:hypothetical protein
MLPGGAGTFLSDGIEARSRRAFFRPPWPQLPPALLRLVVEGVEPPPFLWLFTPSSPRVLLLVVVFQDFSALSPRPFFLKSSLSILFCSFT